MIEPPIADRSKKAQEVEVDTLCVLSTHMLLEQAFCGLNNQQLSVF